MFDSKLFDTDYLSHSICQAKKYRNTVSLMGEAINQRQFDRAKKDDRNRNEKLDADNAKVLKMEYDKKQGKKVDEKELKRLKNDPNNQAREISNTEKEIKEANKQSFQYPYSHLH